MKKFSFISLWSIATLAITTIVFWGIATKAFAYTDADYLAFTPSGCSSSSMTVSHVSPTDFASPIAIWANSIYVLTGWIYTITQDLNMSNCSVFITDWDAAAPIIFDFQWGKSFIDNEGDSNFTIRGINSSHMLEIKWTTSITAILLNNSSWVTISYTQLSGFTLGGIIFDHVINSTISNNNITHNLDWINFQGNSLNNIISNNTITYNTNNGIWLQWGSNGQTLSNNNINNNILDGIFIDGSNANIISNNTGNSNGQYGISFSSCQFNTGNNNIFTNSIMWIYINNSQKNILSNNITKNNTMWFVIENSSSNTFTNNTINTNNLYGLYLSTASGNIFNWWDISYNTGTNIYLESSSNYNQFISTTIKSSTIGLQLDNSKYNNFNGVIIADNWSGTILNTASNNTFSLTNNTNGIYLNMNSNNNNILNTQILGQNNISISNGSNNIITWGLFTATSTTSTSVNINLKNNQGTPTYTITWAGLSWTYPTTAMTGATGTTIIELTTTNNEVKNIAVTYNNGNTQYDSITLWTTNNGGGSNGGGGWGGGWGWSSTPVCVNSNLICTNGIRAVKAWTSCQGGNLGLACSIGSSTTGSSLSWSIAGSTYSTELNNAYLRAYANGITTMNTIQKANMWDTLIRSHMAKMISNFAIRLGGLTLNTWAKCSFADLGNQSTEMKTYIKISCQLGLMGVNMTNFNPNDEITRAQFWTILSRLIWGTTYNTGTPYYLAHLKALKLAGIMTQISDPNVSEIRGYVMLMMKRSYEWGFLKN